MKKVFEILREHPLIVVVVVLFAAYQAFGDALPSVDLEKALDDISSTLGKWTYLAVGVLAFLETGAFVGLVFPGETAVLVAGAIAGRDETSIVLTIAIVWFSAWAGDTASFYLGSKLGKGFILKHGPKVRITEERFEQVEDYFQRYGGRTILIGRFLGLVRALAPFIAGSSGMRYRAFLPYSVLGTGLWAATFSVLGYLLADNIDFAEKLASQGIFVFGAVVGGLLGAYLIVRYMRVEENRQKLARKLEGNRAGAWLVEAGRRVEPQARFLWHRLTPGNLGLEFTTIMAVLAVASFTVVGYGLTVGPEVPDPTFENPTGADDAAFDIADDLRTGWLTDVNEAVTTLGGGYLTIVLGLVAAAVMARKRMWPWFFVLVGGLVIAHVAVPVLKEIVDRSRPSDPLIEIDGMSWPSGHATYAVIYPFLALVATLRIGAGRAIGSGLVVAGVLVAAAVALSRVYLRVHYLSDVTSGAALGTAAFAFCGAIALLVVHFRNTPGESRDPAREDRP